MNIGCLGWGSLIWKPDGLPIAGWMPDGPFLPVEFARQSRDGRLTLVLLPEGERVPVLHGILKVADLDAAFLALSKREGCAKRQIGVWAASGVTDLFDHAEGIGSWAQSKKLDAAIWTALPPKFSGVDGRIPAAVEAISYLTALEGDARRLALVECSTLK